MYRIDNLTYKLQDYLNSNHVNWYIANNCFVITAENDMIQLSFNIEKGKITTKTNLNYTLAYELVIPKFMYYKIKSQNFILDFENEINLTISEYYIQGKQIDN